MPQSKNKTQPTTQTVSAFLNSIEDADKRKDAKKVCALMKEITGIRPKMWGSAIVGFDTYHYTYDSGREGDFFMVGFSPRKNNLSIYIMPGYHDFFGLLQDLGPHKTGKSCLYIKRLSDIDIDVLKQIIEKGYRDMKKRYL